MAETGCKIEHAAASKFREQVMEGQWTKVEATLLDLKPFLKHQRHLQVSDFIKYLSQMGRAFFVQFIVNGYFWIYL